MKLLIVDDDVRLLGELRDYFQRLSFQVETAVAASTALSRLDTFEPDILLLDVQMPEMDGFSLCREIRAHPNYKFGQKGIILFSAVYLEGLDRIIGIETGADRYLLKPIAPRELWAEIKALGRCLQSGQLALPDSLYVDEYLRLITRLWRDMRAFGRRLKGGQLLNIDSFSYDEYLRRLARLWAEMRAFSRRLQSGQPTANDWLSIDGDLRLNRQARIVEVRGEEIHFTPLEFDVLHYLASPPNTACSRDDLAINVWENEEVEDSAITKIISTIRQKIELDPKKPKYIITIHGIGYKLVKED